MKSDKGAVKVPGKYKKNKPIVLEIVDLVHNLFN